MNPFSASAKALAVASLFFAAFFAAIPHIGFAQDDEPNVIGNRIWCDLNMNSTLDGGEKIPDVTIEVTGRVTGYTETQVTDASGN